MARTVNDRLQDETIAHGLYVTATVLASPGAWWRCSTSWILTWLQS
jgi:hypothetical protein